MRQYFATFYFPPLVLTTDEENTHEKTALTISAANSNSLAIFSLDIFGPSFAEALTIA